jgi:anti-sigma-K factor RskA
MRSHKQSLDYRENGLATLEEARRATIAADRLRDGRDFWPGFEAAVRPERGERPVRSAVRPFWRWALGTASLAAVIGIVVLVPMLSRREPRPAAPLEASLSFRVDSVTIEEKPAQAFVFHTQDPDITYVWVEKQL